MTKYQRDWPASPPHSHQPHGLETEHRLTTIEIHTHQHGERLDKHEGRHHTQDVWNKAFTVALLGLASGLAHAKAGDVMATVLRFIDTLRP